MKSTIKYGSIILASAIAVAYLIALGVSLYIRSKCYCHWLSDKANNTVYRLEEIEHHGLDNNVGYLEGENEALILHYNVCPHGVRYELIINGDTFSGRTFR